LRPSAVQARDGEDPLADRLAGEDAVDEEGRGLGHVAGAQACEAVRQDAALGVVAEGVLHVAGQAAPIAGAGVGKFEEGVEVLANDLVEYRVLRLMLLEVSLIRNILRNWRLVCCSTALSYP
jgi:hypothetical protein